VGNISDFVTKAINPRIKSTGLMVGCTKPLIPFQNKHDQSTGECLWSWYRDAANEPDYESLDADLDDLADQYPDLLMDGSGDEQAVNAWEHDLFGSGK
jgi:hypothetical protein